MSVKERSCGMGGEPHRMRSFFLPVLRESVDNGRMLVEELRSLGCRTRAWTSTSTCTPPFRPREIISAKDGPDRSLDTFEGVKGTTKPRVIPNYDGMPSR